jgi:hypothetical protein
MDADLVSARANFENAETAVPATATLRKRRLSIILLRIPCIDFVDLPPCSMSGEFTDLL